MAAFRLALKILIVSNWFQSASSHHIVSLEEWGSYVSIPGRMELSRGSLFATLQNLHLLVLGLMQCSTSNLRASAQLHENQAVQRQELQRSVA